MITDDALRAAAKEASLALAETLVQGSKQQPPYSPSKSFTRKMSRLCRRERHPVFHRTMQRVAAVFLALLLTGIGWLTIDAEARAATIAWFRSISQSSIVYRFLNPAPQQTLPDYTPTWLPDGFEEQEHHKDDQRSSWYYVSGSDFIVIEVDVYHSGTVLSLIGDHSGYEEVHVNQFTALFVPADGNSGISCKVQGSGIWHRRRHRPCGRRLDSSIRRSSVLGCVSGRVHGASEQFHQRIL